MDATVEAAQMNANAKEIAANNNKETNVGLLFFYSPTALFVRDVINNLSVDTLFILVSSSPITSTDLSFNEDGF